MLRGEGEAGLPLLLAAIEAGADLAAVPGAVTAAGEGPSPNFVHSLDTLLPARELLRHRRKYFLGILDPCIANAAADAYLAQRRRTHEAALNDEDKTIIRDDELVAERAAVRQLWTSVFERAKD